MTADILRRLRLFARHPGLAGTAVLLLAVGLSTAGVGHDVFNAVTSPPVAHSDRLARLGASSPVGLPGVGGLPGSLLREIQDATTSFSRIVAVDHLSATLSDESGALAPAPEAGHGLVRHASRVRVRPERACDRPRGARVSGRR